MADRAAEHRTAPSARPDDARNLPGVASSLEARFWHVSPDTIDIYPREKGLQSSLAALIDTRDNSRVAYLRVTFASADLVPGLWGPNGLVYANRYCGVQVGDAGERALVRGQSEQVVRATWTKLSGGWNPSATDAPLSEVRAAVRRVEKRYRKEASATFEYHRVPYVAYAHVDEGYRRRGLGTALYGYAAQQLATKGMVLRASTLQSDSAASLWEHLALAVTYPEQVSSVTLPDGVVVPALDFTTTVPRADAVHAGATER